MILVFLFSNSNQVFSPSLTAIVYSLFISPVAWRVDAYQHSSNAPL